eukprot:NODE_3723_length_348_cov_104.789298_g3641_i0.p3 GENE.NODE_3723_length_348_cov_104.789298_g3641_i0~~NODE_3723_length_348_cov_104.789298_g3641_i0.p3  ORF type:complete len:78 (-),score=14.60 NODE_3723_length_348_cov_104.789298_g3641_i0:87-320(-)
MGIGVSNYLSTPFHTLAMCGQAPSQTESLTPILPSIPSRVVVKKRKPKKALFFSGRRRRQERANESWANKITHSRIK